MGLKGNKFAHTLRHGRIWLGKMATSGIWYCRFKVPETGVQKGPFSLGTTSKREAIDEAEIISSQLLNRTYGIADDTIPFASLADRFFADMENTASAGTVKRLKMTVRVYERWARKHHPKALAAVKNMSEETTTEFRNYRIETDQVAARTADNDVRCLHQIFLWGKGRRLVTRSPARYSRREAGAVRLINAPTGKPVAYTDTVYQSLVRAAEATGDKLLHDLMVLYANTGLRYSEGTHLRPVDIVWNSQQPYAHIRAREDWKPKDPKEEKKIPLNHEVQEILSRRSRHCLPEGVLFPNMNGIPLARPHAKSPPGIPYFSGWAWDRSFKRTVHQFWASCRG